MNYVYSFLQVASGLILLLIPLIVIHWILVTINMREISFITSISGFFFEPLISIIRKIMGTKTVTFKNFTTDLAPLYLCFAVVILSITLSTLSKVIKAIVNFAIFIREKSKVEVVQKQKEIEEKELERRLLENSTGYVIVKTNTQTTSSAYLISSGYNQRDIKEMIEKKLNKYQFFHAKVYSAPSDDNTLALIFEDSLQAVQYCLELQKNMLYLNEQLEKAGVNLNVSCGIYSSTPHIEKQIAFSNAQKICNLASRGEVTCSKIVRDLYDNRKNFEDNYTFVTRGVYYIGEELEIYIVNKAKA